MQRITDVMKVILLIIMLVGCSQTAFATSSVDDLLPDERNNIEIFTKIAPLVVNVHKLNNFIDPNLELLQVETGAGSGFLWDKAGHVVTNYHIIRDASEVAVTFKNGKAIRAKIVGVYPRKDIAVLQLTATEKIPHIENFPVGDSTKLLVGQKVIAIGNPFGLDQTLTRGVISALDRELPSRDGISLRNLIQTDASINPGNSGGPLLNSQGKLIGMNTLIFSTSGGSVGIGFAIPSNDVDRIVSQIIKFGKVTQPGIGVQIFNNRISEQLGIRGALVNKVLPDTPAAKAGLRGTSRDAKGNIDFGDVIVGMNGQQIENSEELLDLLEATKINQEIKLTIVRQGKSREIALKTAELAF